jgi:hypothetical protein
LDDFGRVLEDFDQILGEFSGNSAFGQDLPKTAQDAPGRCQDASKRLQASILKRFWMLFAMISNHEAAKRWGLPRRRQGRISAEERIHYLLL